MLRSASLFLAASLLLIPFRPYAALGRAPSPAAPQNVRRHERAVPGSYIVVLKDEAAGRVEVLAEQLSRAHGGIVAATYRHALRGFSVRMGDAAAEALARNPAVSYVEEDSFIDLASTQTDAPWGLDRIDQASLPLSTTYTYTSTGAGVSVYVIDSGIRTTHQEFGGRASVAYDGVGDGQNGQDCNGHGTRVASIVGGSTYGVAKGALLKAVRVSGCSTSPVSQIIAGVDWLTANHVSPSVALVGFSGGGNPTLDTAVRGLISSGVTTVVAAGNINADAGTRSPSRVTEALTVGAVDQFDTRAGFSNFGSALDLFAPGADIPAANWFDDTATAVDSGTSMAAAHAAGVAATYLETHASASPAQVNQAIIDNSTTGVVNSPGTNSPNRLLHVINPPPPPAPSVVATKTDSYASQTGSAMPGDTITYTVNISNVGTADATSVAFNDTVDPNTTLVPGSVSGGGGVNVSGGMLSVNVGTLPPGGNVTITFQVTVNNPYSGGPNVVNQGLVSGSNFANVLTDDPDAFGQNDPTLTPIYLVQIRANDARQPEPATGVSQMLFAVTLSNPAPAGGLSVNYATAGGGTSPATGGASCDGTSDYVNASGTLAFAAGQRVRTIPVNVCSDNVGSESDETLLMNLSSQSFGSVLDAQAMGTITQGYSGGTLIISELRTSGPAGAGDDFVELYNNTNSPQTAAASDGSAGYGVYKMGADCNAEPVLIATIPNGTVIPARGHRLLVGSAYSLSNYGGTGAAAGDQALTSDIENDANVAVFSTADVNNLSTAARLDAVGFGTNTGGGVCDLLREGANLPAVSGSTTEHSFFRKECDYVTNVGCAANGNPKDSHNNAQDFLFADTQVSLVNGLQRLGAPGPENSSSPLRRDDAGVSASLLDGTKSTSVVPNRERFLSPTNPNTSPQGRLEVRRRVQNTTASTVTRLRFRIMEMTTGPTPPVGTADLRAITSSAVVINNVTDAATCASTGTPTSVPCTVTAQATVLETPPTQTVGGGYNSTVSVSIPGGLAPNASIDVNFALGVVQSGTFRFYIIVEALP